MKAKYILFLLGTFLVLLLGMEARATHVRAGEITTRRISESSLTYEITLTVYFDVQRGAPAANTQNDVEICFGVNNDSRRVDRLPPPDLRNVNPNTTINIYRTTYTYPGPGRYPITCIITNRNAETRNIPGSIDVSFELRTTIVVNASLGLNSTPVMLNPPLDSARVGQKFCHNPAAFDVDGDSLSYKLFTPSGRVNAPPGSCTPRFVSNYIRPETIGTNPTTEAGTGPATLTVDPVTGDVCWDSPAEAGQYNIAFIIEEWRDGVKIGEIVRDMQIIVTPTTNRRPQLPPLPDICVEAGRLISIPIQATDPDGNRLQLFAYGGIFNRGPDDRPLPANQQLILPEFATLVTPNQPQVGGTATGTVRWQTNCNHIRQEPYDVVVRVVDLPRTGQTQLATLESFKIRIVAPSPRDLTARASANASGRTITLNWAAYTCALPGAEMVVYRREGCSNTRPDVCQTGIPPGEGYTEVGRVPIGTTTFTDNNNGRGLARGISYSYRIVAAFREPRGGASVASTEICLSLPLQVPLITNVTVDTTDNTRGRITVRWTRPPGINPADLGGPFQYRLFRAVGLNGENFTQVATINTTLSAGAADTVYIDRGLNTVENAYRYRLEFFYTDAGTGQLTRLDATEAASSVRLAVSPGSRRITLNWQANTPWNNDNQRHRVYRSKTGPNGPFNQIAEVQVQGPTTYTFTDTGADTFLADGSSTATMTPDSNYCYRVETVGTYSATVRPGLLFNFSQGICAAPIDTTRPCPPILAIDTLNCAALSSESFCDPQAGNNNLTWRNPQTVGGRACDQNIVRYNVYYSRYQDDQPQVIATVQSPTMAFQHTNLATVTGCYYVTAVSRSGIESGPSNRVCKEACPNFQLPNVFTPNADGRNDIFQPLRCPSSVESVEFAVFNRFGAKVFETRDPNINWTGVTSAGQELPSGTYYYTATVRFATSQRNSPPVVFKGWVQLLREVPSR